MTHDENIKKISKSIKQGLEEKEVLLDQSFFSSLSFKKKTEFCKLNAMLASESMKLFELCKNDRSSVKRALKAFDIAYSLQDHIAESHISHVINSVTLELLSEPTPETLPLQEGYAGMDPRHIYLKALQALLGCSEDENFHKGITLLKFAAVHKDEAALLMLGQIYYGHKMYNLAYETLEQVGGSRASSAIYIRGLIEEQASNPEAANYWKRAASLGNKKALNNLACTILDEAEKNHSELNSLEKQFVKECYQLSALQNDKDACFNLGVFYYHEGEAPNAQFYLIKAHDLGHPDAEDTLADLFPSQAISSGLASVSGVFVRPEPMSSGEEASAVSRPRK